MNERLRSKREASAGSSPTHASFDQRWVWRIGAMAIVITPLLVTTSGQDLYRLPKELFLRACGVMIACLLLVGAVWSSSGILRSVDLRRPTVALSILIVFWTGVTAISSTNPRLSLFSVVWVISAALLLLAIETGAGSRSLAVLAIGMLPAVLNASLAVVQELRIWNPFIPLASLYNPAGEKLTGLRGTVGFLGNPNDIGTYLLPTLVCAFAASVSCRKWRFFWIAIAAITLAGIIVSQSVASFVAAGASLLTLALLSPRRVRWTLLVTLIVSFSAAIALIPPIRQRIAKLPELVRTGRYEEIVSGRLIGSLSAWEMFKQHPVLGVGPGAFGYQFFDYSIVVRRRSPRLFQQGVEMPNFAEAHNDHLQVLAATGVAGYGLMLAAVAFLGSRSFIRGPDDDERARFARLASLPLAIGFSVSALAQFPLEIAAALTAYLFYSALCVAWSTGSASP